MKKIDNLQEAIRQLHSMPALIEVGEDMFYSRQQVITLLCCAYGEELPKGLIETSIMTALRSKIYKVIAND